MLDLDLATLLQVWGKTDRSKPHPRPFHPLLCHLIDVAMVALALWEEGLTSARTTWLAQALGLAPADAGRWVAFLAGVHDLGKATPGFQAKDSGGEQRLRAAGLLDAVVAEAPHGLLSTDLLRRLLVELFDMPKPVANAAAAAAGAHHGVFPSSADIADLLAAVGGGQWPRVQRQLVRVLADVVGVPADRPRDLPIPAVLPLAGIIAVADWIGSNAELFPFAAAPPQDVKRYARERRQAASAALRQLRWTSWKGARDERGFAELFPAISAPNAVQRESERLAADLPAPALVIIESPMGSGKTEAALTIADRWLVRDGRQGIYLALPTMATSNQMFERVRRFLAQRFPGEMVNLQLLHGHAAISAELQTMVERLRFAPEALVDIDGEGAVIAAEWFTYRKRGLLAPFGVGTVDQALLAILRARHGFVRLFGLAGKVVIIDEVHAYDTYMSRLLDRLLEWLAALGSPVILLSATLPASRRRELVAAYRRGLGAPAQEPPAVSYPRLTWATAAHVAAQAVQHQGGARSVQVVPLPASSRLGDLGGRLADALRDGGCAVVICNTVGRAQQVYQALKPLFSGRADDDFPVLDLLHARYLVDEREERERRVRGRFGKPSESVRPNRAVLVATQVVEQSLDLDFDLLVTDLAPADLVLQRAGRLHRHERPRPAPLAAPTLWLLMPDLDPSGQLALDRADLAVYGEHVLLRSWLALRDRRSILLPEEIEPLVEAVYGEGTPDALPEPLRQQWQRSEHAHREALAKDDEEAKRRWIPAPLAPVSVWSLGGPALAEEDPTFHQDHQALTRLAEPAVEVVLLTASPVGPRLPDGRIVDLANTPDLELTRTLLRRSVRISHRRVAPALLSEPAPAGWARSALLRNARLLVLDEAGSAPLPGGGTLRLDPELGVVVEGE